MSVNPIDAQIMVLNQANVGKEQQSIKDAHAAMVREDADNFNKEAKINEERVIQSDNSEQNKLVSDKDKQKQENEKQKNKNKKQNEEDKERKEIEHIIDPVRGRILDIET